MLGQKHPKDSARPIAYDSLDTFASERHWTPVDLEADSIHLGRSSIFEADFGVRTFPLSRITRLWKVSEKLGTTTCESSGVSSVSTRSAIPASIEREAPAVTVISLILRHSWQLSTTAVDLTASHLKAMRPYPS